MMRGTFALKDVDLTISRGIVVDNFVPGIEMSTSIYPQ
jgi:hypothetical protein